MDEKTLFVMKKAFKHYYFKHADKVYIPRRIEEKEFGYVPFGGTMIRHLSFTNEGQLIAMLVREAPASAYYSCAFYNDPSRSMPEKGWKLAELAFDIDAEDLQDPCRKDHDIWRCVKCGSSGRGQKPAECSKCKTTKIREVPFACPLCLDSAKREVLKLCSFLQSDFGVGSKDIRIYYSGNLGYHVSVDDEVLSQLEQIARHEIVDYLVGRGIMPEILGIKKGIRLRYDELLSRLPDEKELGWRGRIARYFQENFGSEERSDAKKSIASLYAKSRYNRFKTEFENVVSKAAVKIDPSVTTDIFRILRLPGTLHNASGLLKKEVKNLDSFDPLVDAVALGSDPLKVEVNSLPVLHLLGQKHGPFSGGTYQLPTYLAVYITAHGEARILED